MRLFLIGFLFSFSPLLAQPAFDAASIRKNLTETNNSSINHEGGRLTLTNTSLRDCIAFAYNIPTGRDYELSGPAWLDTEKFDVMATFPLETSRERYREMLQNLLADRFGLTTHFENRKLKAYALVVAKHGSKLQANTNGAEGAFIFGEDHITGRALSITYLADRLSSPTFKLDRPVVDSTGIKGAYDFTLNWGPNGPSIFTSLEEQLGLKLQPRQVSFRILVVDHVDRDPTPN